MFYRLTCFTLFTYFLSGNSNNIWHFTQPEVSDIKRLISTFLQYKVKYTNSPSKIQNSLTTGKIKSLKSSN